MSDLPVTDAETGDAAILNIEDGPDGEPEIQQLPLDAWHRARGARMVAFAGYDMPIQYDGIMAEHLWTRESAGLFDVSHMGQLVLTGDAVDVALEALLPGDITGLGEPTDALFAAARRGRRDSGRSDGHPARGGILPRRQRRDEVRRHLASARSPARRRHDQSAGRAGAGRGAGAEGGRCAVAAGAGRRRPRLHDRGRVRVERHAAVDFALGLYGRGRVRDFDPRRAGCRLRGCAVCRAGGQADRVGWRAIRSGWRRGCRCTVTTSTPTRRW